MLRTILRGFLKSIIFGCFLAALAAFSGMATLRYIFATGTVEVPDLVGKDMTYAVDWLAESHLTLKTVDQQFDRKIPKDHIMAQDPPPGTMIKKNRLVRVVLSRGAESAVIPEIIGKRWQEAARFVKQQRFRMGNVAYVHSSEVPVDHILAQTPLPHSESSIGERVDLLVSLGPYKKVMVMPDLVEEQLAYALQVVEKLGLVLGKVEYDPIYPEVPPNTVLNQVPKPGTLVEEQNIVNFVVSGTRPSSDTMTDSPSSVKFGNLEYIIPPGRFDREVMILVKNAEGTSEMFRQFIPPGNRIVVRIPVVGETVAEIYLDGILEEVRRF